MLRRSISSSVVDLTSGKATHRIARQARLGYVLAGRRIEATSRSGRFPGGSLASPRMTTCTSWLSTKQGMRLTAAEKVRNCSSRDFRSCAIFDFFNSNGGGFNWSAQHSSLLAKMECGHETATSHLLFCSSGRLGSSAASQALQAGLPSVPEPDSIDQAAAAMVTGTNCWLA